MYDPRLNPDEHVLIRSDNVRIKGRSFTAVLTDRRLILAGDENEEPQGENIEYDTGLFRKVSLSDTGTTVNIEVEGEELSGNLELSFPGEPPRSDEPDDWASALHILISKRRLPDNYLFESEIPVVERKDIDTLFEKKPEVPPIREKTSNKDRNKKEKEIKKRERQDKKREKEKIKKEKKAEKKDLGDEMRGPGALSNIFGYLYAPGRSFSDFACNRSTLAALIYFLVCGAAFSIIFSSIQYYELGIGHIQAVSYKLFAIFAFCALLFGIFLHIGTKIGGGRGGKGIGSTYKAIMYSVMPFVVVGWISFNGTYYGLFIAILWSAAIMIKGLSIVHEISASRALFVFLIALILVGLSIFIVNKMFFLADKIEEFNMLKSGMNLTSPVSSPTSLPETTPTAASVAVPITAIPTMISTDEFEKITVTGQAVVAGVSPYTPVRTSSQMELPYFEPASGPQFIHTINHTFRYRDKEITVSIPIDERIYLGATQGTKGAIISSDLSQQDWEPDYYRSFIEQSDLYTLYDSIAGALQQVKSRMKLDDDEYAELITVYVQSIPYERNKIIWAPKFPIETVYEGKGDCDDKSILLNALLAEEDYNSAFLSFGEEEHMATGIKSITGSYRNTGYVFIETSDVDYIGTVPIGLETGVKLLSTPLVIKTGKGTGMTYNSYPDTQALRDSLEKAWNEQEELKPGMDLKWELLSEKMSEIELLKPTMEEYKTSGDIENYNLLVEEYNALCGGYTNISEEYSVLTRRYEALGELARNINERRYDRPGAYSYLREWENLFGWAS